MTCPLLVQQADQQRDAFGIAGLAHVVDIGDASLASEVGDLARRHTVQPLLGRTDRIEGLQMGQPLLELA